MPGFSKPGGRDPRTSDDVTASLAVPALAQPSRDRTIPAVSVTTPTDGDLLVRIGTGDRRAFEQLYERYARPVFGLALRRLGDRERAEEAVQETFAAVWRAARSYQPDRGPGAP